MNNKTRSPLYSYVENKLKDESVNKLILLKAQAAVAGIIANCCPVIKPTKNDFLKGFYALLKTMPKQYSLTKIIAVNTLLTNKIACC